MVSMAMSAVLSWFIFNILSHIHSATSSIQSFKLWTRAGKFEEVLELWSWESSAKKWYEWPDLTNKKFTKLIRKRLWGNV